MNHAASAPHTNKLAAPTPAPTPIAVEVGIIFIDPLMGGAVLDDACSVEELVLAVF